MNPSLPDKEKADLRVIVVIPLYKSALDADELVSLRRCFEVLGSHPICFVRPEGSSFEYEALIAPYRQYPFPASYFRSVQDYNRLMLTPDFYRAFAEYEYMLLYQTDAFVFEDRLAYWCAQEYDYAGAPWLRPGLQPRIKNTLKIALKGWWHRKRNILDKKTGLPSDYQLHNQVGNGGFSLRRIQKFMEIAGEASVVKDKYLSEADHRFNEDVFWGVEVNRRRNRLRIPDVFTALEFAVENKLEKSFLMLGHKQPFGCHAWNLHKPFWRETFARLGYTI